MTEGDETQRALGDLEAMAREHGGVPGFRFAADGMMEGAFVAFTEPEVDGERGLVNILVEDRHFVIASAEFETVVANASDNSELGDLVPRQGDQASLEELQQIAADIDGALGFLIVSDDEFMPAIVRFAGAGTDMVRLELGSETVLLRADHYQQVIDERRSHG